MCVFTEGLIRMGGGLKPAVTDWQPSVIERCPSKSRDKARDLEVPGGPRCKSLGAKAVKGIVS